MSEYKKQTTCYTLKAGRGGDQVFSQVFQYCGDLNVLMFPINHSEWQQRQSKKSNKLFRFCHKGPLSNRVLAWASITEGTDRT